MTDLEPDGWRWRDNAGVNQATINDPIDPWADYNKMFGKEPMSTWENVREEIDRRIESKKTEIEEIGEASTMSSDAVRKGKLKDQIEELEELKERFKQE